VNVCVMINFVRDEVRKKIRGLNKSATTT
jgi:hypothetical protein